MVYNLTPILCSRHVKTMDLSSVEECLYFIPMALGNYVGLPTYLFSCPSEFTHNHRSRFALPTHFDILSMLSFQAFMSYSDHISSLIPDFYVWSQSPKFQWLLCFVPLLGKWRCLLGTS